MKSTEDVMNIIETYVGNDIDLCFYILQVLKKKENPADGLKIFLKM